MGHTKYLQHGLSGTCVMKESGLATQPQQQDQRRSKSRPRCSQDHKLGDSAARKTKIELINTKQRHILDTRESINHFTDVTGVDTHVSEICASISNQIYGAYSDDYFHLKASNGVRAKVLKLDTHGKMNPAIPAFAVAVFEDTLIMCWVSPFTIIYASSSRACVFTNISLTHFA